MLVCDGGIHHASVCVVPGRGHSEPECVESDFIKLQGSGSASDVKHGGLFRAGPIWDNQRFPGTQDGNANANLLHGAFRTCVSFFDQQWCVPFHGRRRASGGRRRRRRPLLLLDPLLRQPSVLLLPSITVSASHRRLVFVSAASASHTRVTSDLRH